MQIIKNNNTTYIVERSIQLNRYHIQKDLFNKKYPIDKYSHLSTSDGYMLFCIIAQVAEYRDEISTKEITAQDK